MFQSDPALSSLPEGYVFSIPRNARWPFGATLALAERAHARSGDERARLDALASDHRQHAEAVAREFGGQDLLERCANGMGPTPEASGGADPRDGVDAGVRLKQEGEYWTLSDGKALCRVQDSRGVRMLAQLMDHPGREIHVLDLSGSPSGVDASDAGEVLDAQARAEYQQRLSELRAELSEASGFNDLGRQQRLSEEIDALMSELSRGFGLGGRARRSGSAVERARINVRRRITLALRRIRAASPELGEHLERCVQTGIYCVYTPGPH